MTRDEEIHLPRALESLRGIDCDVFVVDSGSTDRTVDIATAWGAVVAYHPWTNYSSQFDWAMRHIPFLTPWMMRLDADETLEPELAQELQDTLPNLASHITGLNIRRKHVFMGRWIRHGGRFPVTLLRVWRSGAATIESRWMDEHMILSYGDVIQLRHSLRDENVKPLTYFVAKHNSYADRESIDVLAHRYFSPGTLLSDSRLPSGQSGRKRRIKAFYWTLPLGFGPIAYFFYRYFLRLGFLDGWQGVVYHVLQGLWYRFLVDVKVASFYHELDKLGSSSEKLEWLARETGLNLQDFPIDRD